MRYPQWRVKSNLYVDTPTPAEVDGPVVDVKFEEKDGDNRDDKRTIVEGYIHVVSGLLLSLMGFLLLRRAHVVRRWVHVVNVESSIILSTPFSSCLVLPVLLLEAVDLSQLEHIYVSSRSHILKQTYLDNCVSASNEKGEDCVLR